MRAGTPVPVLLPRSPDAAPRPVQLIPPVPQPPSEAPLRPLLTLEPLAAKSLPARMTTPVDPIHFWKDAPRGVKSLLFAIPVLLSLALHSKLPVARAAGFEHALDAPLGNVRQAMLDRAAIALSEDFRSGLDDWVSRDGAATDWSFDATGFVRPGPLALYRPSVELRDYQLQFLGLIDKKALSWVVRAADFRNYYVVKLAILKAGPLPVIGVTRYAVVNGRPDSRVDSIAHIDARSDTLYRVSLDVHGDTYVLSVQGRIAEVWSEPRLRHGGVGFFTARGEESRLRWVQVTHQYDALGRLCAYFAPYNNAPNNDSTKGNWQP